LICGVERALNTSRGSTVVKHNFRIRYEIPRVADRICYRRYIVRRTTA
jgi:hypothetical protein